MTKAHYSIVLEDLCAEIILKGGHLADDLHAADIAPFKILLTG
ncbi:hypothetical protein Z949_3691 [Sulfitobacter guttiformis KCTC 32187]|nr:hypothetical protein Z949_3691 [Sulfitobacter guttiformis KCTC 32187]